MNWHKHIFCFFLIFISFNLSAQKTSVCTIIPVEYPDSVPQLNISPEKVSLAKKTIESKESANRNIYAYPVDVELDIIKKGYLSVLDDGRKVWRYQIYSEGASSLSLIFSGYNLMRGSKLIIYTPDKSKILGSFTEDNNKPFGTLAISPVKGDKLIIELQTSRGQKYPGTLVLGTVGHGFEKGNKSAEDAYFGSSRECNVDINCQSDSVYQTVKRAVCRVFYGATGACTGTLVNNSSFNGKAYVIMANHCFSSEYLANNAVFHFNYESPYCDGPDAEYDAISGSEIVSTSTHLDFTLVELSEMPDFNYGVYYAGWNIEEEATDSVFTIHHPKKDVKKISFSKEKPYIGNWANGYDSYVHWIVEKYEYGTTELFSSGAPLFNKKGEIIGVLSGGILDTCGYVYDNFQRIVNAYDDYARSEEQLACWLNPEGYDIMFLQGYDPYDIYRTHGEYLSHFLPDDDTVIIENTNGWGYLTGHNSNYTAEYAEKYEFNGNKYILGAYIIPGRVYNQYDSSSIVIRLWEGNETPETVLQEKRIYYYQMENNQPLFIQFDSSAFLRKSFFIGYQIHYNTLQDTFSMNTSDTWSDYDENYVFKYENGSWRPLSENNSLSLAIFPLVSDYEKSILKPFEEINVDRVLIYPMPAHNELIMYFMEDEINEIEAELFDLSGRLVRKVKYFEPTKNISLDLVNIKSGQYILKLTYNDERIYRKVIVVN